MARNYYENLVKTLFLPFGITSHQAAMMAYEIEPNSFEFYNPNVPMDQRIRACVRCRMRVEKQFVKLIKKGYIIPNKRKYGNLDYEVLRFFQLTKTGFLALANVWNAETEAAWAIDGINKRKNGILNSRISRDIYNQLLDLQTDQFAPLHSQVNESFEKTVYTGIISPLARYPKLAEQVIVNLNRVNQNQLYRNWRLSNIYALFRINDFLTCLDRRPIDIGWNIDGQKPEQVVRRMVEKGKLDIPSYTCLCLDTWYREHPDSYKFINPGFSDPDWDTNQNSCAFYAAGDLYSYAGLPTEEAVIATSKNVVRHTFMGLAEGRYRFIVHHTQARGTPWMEEVENSTIMAVQKSLRVVGKVSEADSGEAQYALIVTPTYYQFKALFTDFYAYLNALPEPLQNLHRRRIGAPYKSVHIVPLCNSGTFELRALLIAGPEDFTRQLKVQYLTLSPDKIRENDDNLFPLTYEGRPLFIGHLMPYAQIYDLWEEYKAGKDFVIGCYPEQVSYYHWLMPNVEFI